MPFRVKSIGRAQGDPDIYDFLQLQMSKQMPVAVREQREKYNLRLFVAGLDKERSKPISFWVAAQLLEMPAIASH